MSNYNGKRLCPCLSFVSLWVAGLIKGSSIRSVWLLSYPTILPGLVWPLIPQFNMISIWPQNFFRTLNPSPGCHQGDLPSCQGQVFPGPDFCWLCHLAQSSLFSSLVLHKGHGLSWKWHRQGAPAPLPRGTLHNDSTMFQVKEQFQKGKTNTSPTLREAETVVKLLLFWTDRLGFENQIALASARRYLSTIATPTGATSFGGQ